jgi:hypothetical protein
MTNPAAASDSFAAVRQINNGDPVRSESMPSNIRIIRASDFIVASPDGRLDLRKSKALLVEIATMPPPSSDYEILIDTRKATVDFSIADLYDLAEVLGRHRKAFSRKTAVLCPPDGFNDAGFFALCAKIRDFQVSAFVSYEEAIEWLVEDGD